jgi:radical SAM protein with 4Fe4S-binding SPASM domain
MNKRIDELKQTDTFCSAPWSHLHVLPEGDVLPCCMWDYGVYEDGGRFGNINDYDDIQDLFNNERFRELRQSFLSNKSVDGCHRCYHKEKFNRWSSFRTFMNGDKILTEDVERTVMSTHADGSIDDITVTYLDIRFGNICNLKCRMCGHHLSSTWYDELVREAEITGGSAPDQKFVHVDCYDKIEPFLDSVTEIYFAGGEPTLYPEHLRILDHLVEIGNTDLHIRYNTNMSSLKYKGRDFIDVWQNFSHVSIGASIDDQGAVVSYIRTGLDWERVCNNMSRLITEAPHVRTVITPTIGILNLETFPAFHQFAIENGWCSADRYSIGYVDWPQYMNIRNLPEWYQQEMIRVYMQHREWLADHAAKYHVNDPEHSLTLIDELIARLQVPADKQTVQEALATLRARLSLWEQTATLDWQTDLPHIKRLLENQGD